MHTPNRGHHNLLKPTRWSLAAQFAGMGILLVIISLVGIGIASTVIVQRTLTSQIGESFEVKANSLNDLVTLFFREKVSQLQTLAVADSVIQGVIARNRQYTGTEADILAEILALDAIWVGAADDDPLIKTVVTSEATVNLAAVALANFLAQFPEHSEVFVTDRYGATLAATGRLSDYYQADEDWWQAAWQAGQGTIYISQPVFDESAKVTALRIALPIYDPTDKDIVGILRSTLAVNELFELFSAVRFGETGQALLLNQTNHIIFSSLASIDVSSARIVSADTILGTPFSFTPDRPQTATEMLFTITDQSRAQGMLLAQTRLGQLQFGENDLTEIEMRIQRALDALGWTIVVAQEAEEAFLSLRQINQTLWGSGLVLFLLGGFVILIAARIITRPLSALSKAAERIGAGDLETPLPVTGNHETYNLTLSFEKMVAQLREAFATLELRVSERTAELTATNQRLAQEIAERKQTEETLRESEERFRSLAGATFEGIIIHEKGIMLNVNQVIADMHGYALAELIGQPFTKITAPEALDKVQHNVKIGYNQPYESIGLRKDGTRFAVEVYGRPIPYQGRIARVAAVRDISQRKQVEAEINLLVQMNRFRAEVGLALTHGKTLQAMLQGAAEAAVRCLNISFARIWSYNPVETVLELQASAGLHTGIDGDHSRLSLDDTSKIGFIAQQQKPYLTNNFPQDPFLDNQAWAEAEELVAFAGYPLTLGETLFGVMAVFAHQPFAEKLTQALEIVSNMLAMTIERRYTYRALRQNEARYRAIYNTPLVMFQSVDTQGQLTDVNDYWLEKLGYTDRSEVLGKRAAEFLTEASRQYAQGVILPEFLATGEKITNIPYQFVKKDGSVIDVLQSSIVEMDDEGNITNSLAAIIDITDRKRAEEERDRIFNISVDMMCIAGDDGFFKRLNAAFKTTLGYDEAEMLAKPFIEFVHADDIENTLLEFNTLIAGALTLNFENRYRCKDGSYKWLEWTAVPAQGVIYAVARDVTGRKETEKALRQMRDDLEVMVQQRTVDLVKTTETLKREIEERKQIEAKIEASLQEKELLLQEVHHRVKNNLQVTSSLIFLQSSQVQDMAYRRMFIESRDRILSMALIHEKLYQTQDWQQINFAEYIEALIAHLIKSQHLHATTVQMQLDVEAIFLGIDQAVPCALIVNELVTNILKHAFPDHRSGTIYLAFYKQEAVICLIIEDNGVGFSDNAKIKASNSLGLQIVKTLVRQLRGTLSINERTQGSRFVIQFPDNNNKPN